ncbi:MAG: hypothetical protein GX075_08175 [Firmicutes bacterium]|nr:hypothetical protein [Bacillota bacterium]
MARLAVFPTVGMVVKKTFKEIYQSFSYSVLTSMIAAVAYLPILFVFFGMFVYISESADQSMTINHLIQILLQSLFLSAIWNTLAAAPITTTLYSLYQERKEGYPGFKTFFILLWKHYRASFVVNGLSSLVVILLVLNILIAIKGQLWIFFLSGMVSFYFLIFLVLMSFFFAPLIHLGNGIKKTFKKAFLLVIDNTGPTMALMLLLGVFFVLTLIFAPIWILTYGAILIYVTDLGFYAIYDRYDS